LSRWTRGHIACSLIMLMLVSSANAAPVPPQEPDSTQEAQSAQAVHDQTQNVDSQATEQESNTTQPEQAIPANPTPVSPQVGDQNGQPKPPQSGSDQEQTGAPKPVGTAAAPYEKTTGVAASRPAGAVIAPARQRRARTILIRFAVVVGAAVAVGTVVALSHGSPSRP
jgi:cytoskeletal protein RodZ